MHRDRFRYQRTPGTNNCREPPLGGISRLRKRATCLSQTTLIWVGAAAVAVVVAGAAAGALVWTHPDFVWPGPAGAPVEATRPRARRAQRVPPAPPLPPDRRGARGARVRPSTAAAASARPPSHAKPAFDVVTVEPTGEAVIAGRAAPNAKVELRDAGKTVAEATADASGQFVIIPPTFAPGDHSLSLAADAGKAEPETSKAVAVSVPPPEAKAAVAAAAPTQRRPSPSPPPPPRRCDADPGDAPADRRLPRRHPVGRGRRRRRARRQRLGRAEFDRAPLSQRRRRRRRQDESRTAAGR